MENLFRVISIYEQFIELQGAKRIVRVEILQSIVEKEIYRGRIWIQNIYNLYPALLNTDKSGKDLRSMHSADEINVEISALVIKDESYLVGKPCKGEKEILDYVVERIAEYVKSLE